MGWVEKWAALVHWAQKDNIQCYLTQNITSCYIKYSKSFLFCCKKLRMLLCYSTFFVALLEKETFPHSLSDCKLCQRRKIAMPLRPEGSSAAHRSFARVQPVQSVQKGFIHRECKARGSCSLASQSAWGSQMNLIRKLCTTSAEHPLPPSRDLNLAKQARNLWPKRKRNKKNKNCAQPKPQGKSQKLSGKKRRRVGKKW